jgi:hypothetical protein
LLYDPITNEIVEPGRDPSEIVTSLICLKMGRAMLDHGLPQRCAAEILNGVEVEDGGEIEEPIEEPDITDVVDA